MATLTGITARERREIQKANESGRTPVVFVHGLWLHASSWAPWRDYFEREGYATLAPGYPGDPESVAAGAVTELETFAGRGHSLTIDPGWPELAEHARAFFERTCGGYGGPRPKSTSTEGASGSARSQ